MFTIAAGRTVAGCAGVSGQPDFDRLIGFRERFHALLWRRADALLELTDAMLCAQGAVRSAAELSMEPEFRRGHGSLYGALAEGRIDPGELRRLLMSASSPARTGEPLMFAIYVTPHTVPTPSTPMSG